jgi:hypothetical protein
MTPFMTISLMNLPAMRYLPLSLLLLAVPAQAEDTQEPLSSQACLELIRGYWSAYEINGVEPADLFDRFVTRCEPTPELDKLILTDKHINEIADRLKEQGVID